MQATTSSRFCIHFSAESDVMRESPAENDQNTLWCLPERLVRASIPLGTIHHMMWILREEQQEKSNTGTKGTSNGFRTLHGQGQA